MVRIPAARRAATESTTTPTADAISLMGAALSPLRTTTSDDTEEEEEVGCEGGVDTNLLMAAAMAVVMRVPANGGGGLAIQCAPCRGGGAVVGVNWMTAAAENEEEEGRTALSGPYCVGWCGPVGTTTMTVRGACFRLIFRLNWAARGVADADRYNRAREVFLLLLMSLSTAQGSEEEGGGCGRAVCRCMRHPEEGGGRPHTLSTAPDLTHEIHNRNLCNGA